MTGRAIGCAVIGVVVFVAIGIFGLSRALAPSGCPDRLQYAAEAFLPEGTPSADAAEGKVEIGSTFIGLTTRAVYAETARASGAEELPEVIVLDCGDGTFLTYRSQLAGEGER